MATETARPGWFMVGDSAATLDPTSSHGVLKALMSGMMAGHLIAGVLDGMAPAEEAAMAYHAWMPAGFGRMLSGWHSFTVTSGSQVLNNPG
jgi:flavin-dependent dehydrogenase